MGVEFRWQVKDEEEWESSPSPPERRRRFPWRLVGLLVLLLAVGAGIAAGRFWQGARQGEARLKRELAAAANLEARALRDGDREMFLSLQDRDDTVWYAHQERRAPSWRGFADLEAGQQVDLAVLNAALLTAQDDAWAEVAWALEDGIYRRVQFYRRVAGQWLRTGVRHEYFGQERTRQTAHFAFKYQIRDEPTVDWMAKQLEDWYEVVCRDLSCDDSRRINVLITALDAIGGEEYRPPEGFTLSSPRLRGVREDGALLPEERRELSHILIYLLAVRRTGDVDAWQQPYLLPQFVNWEMRRLGLANDDTPPTPVLDRVMASHGIEGVRAVLAVMAQTNSEDEALRQALGLDLESLDMVFGRYLAALLALERQAMEWQTSGLVGPTAELLARRTFDALLIEGSGGWRSQKDVAFQGWRTQPGAHYYEGVSLSHPEVNYWELLDDSTMWAEVSYREAMVSVYSGSAVRRVEFFRRVDGAWRHAPPDERFLGAEVVLNSQHFRVECHEREAELVARGLVHLESLYRRVADAVQAELPPGERLTIEVVPPASRHYDSGTEKLQVSSPYLLGWDDDWEVNYLAGSVSSSLVSPGLDAVFPQQVNHLAGSVSSSLLRRLLLRAAGVTDVQALTWPRDVWLEGIVGAWMWQQDIFGSQTTGGTLWFLVDEPLASAAGSGELLPLSELERVSFGSLAPPNWSQNNWDLFYQEVFAVMHYVGEAYGDQAFLSLSRSLPEAESLSSWLQLALDVDLETFEAGWQAWLREQVDR